MTQFAHGGGQMWTGVPPTNMCDYCHQKPKRHPYDYCSKDCGSRANASGSNPAICKQCGQRPVYKGHQFCGKNCANAWQTMSGHINTGWNGPSQPQHGQQHQWYTTPAPQTQNPLTSNLTQSFQGVNRGARIVNGLKGLVSKGQQPGPSNPAMISPPITPMSSTGTPTPMLNQQYYAPSTPTSPGIQDPDANGQTNGYPPISIQVGTQAQFSMQSSFPPVPSHGHGNGNWDPNYLPSPQSTATPPSATCRLNGCNKPVFVDSVTNLPSEYCSQSHREDATTFGQVNPCIMCLKMPRGLNDHFCSWACREKALNP